jgi:RNA polymerase sigma factor (sigma-70 family)
MENSDDSDITLERIIPEAIKGNLKALDDDPLASRWLTQLLDRITVSTSWQYKVDADDVRDVISEKLVFEICTVVNPHNIPWRDCLESWCWTVARHYCLNVIRHRGVVNKHQDSITHDNTNSTKIGGSIFVTHSAVASPEEELLKKEQNRLWEDRTAEIRRKVQEIVGSLPPEHAEIALMFLWEKKPVEEIIKETNKSSATVYRILKKINKAIIKKIRVEQILEDQPEHAAGLKELIANSLSEMASSSHAQRQAV